MKKSKIILIKYNNEKEAAETYDHVISISALLTDITKVEIVKTINKLSAIGIPSVGCLEYTILWHKITNRNNIDLATSILLVEKLKCRLEDLGVTHGTLVCEESLDEPYARIVRDVATENNLEIERESYKSWMYSMSMFTQYFITLLKMSSLIGDWFFAKLTRQKCQTNSSNIVYFPPIGRLNSTLSVVHHFDLKPRTIITEPKWYYLLQLNAKKQLRDFHPTVTNQYLTLPGFIGQLRDIGTITYELMAGSSFTQNIIDQVEQEFNMSLDTTTSFHIKEALSNFRITRALILRRSLRTVFKQDNVKKVIFGTFDPIGRAISYEALDQGLQVYHIPHSIATTRPPNPQSNVTSFLSGNMDKWYFEQVIPQNQQWEWVVAGRPYLTDLYQEYEEFEKKSGRDIKKNETIRVVIATQPLSGDKRKQFIQAVLNTFDSDKFNLIIKPHPDENIVLYEEAEQKYDHVQLITDQLYQKIVTSDLTVTIQSNVGLESMVIGTPTVCFNPWRPLVLDQTFMLSDHVPIFRSKNELQIFINHLNINRLSQLEEKQKEFVKQRYCLDVDAAADVAEYIISDKKAIIE